MFRDIFFVQIRGVLPPQKKKKTKNPGTSSAPKSGYPEENRALKTGYPEENVALKNGYRKRIVH